MESAALVLSVFFSLFPHLSLTRRTVTNMAVILCCITVSSIPQMNRSLGST